MPEPSNPRIRLDQGCNMGDPMSELMPGELALARNCHYEPESGNLKKLPGRALYAAMGAQVKGLGWVRFRDGSIHLIGASGTSYYTSAIGSAAWTARATGLTAVGLMEAHYHPQTNRVYLNDGINGMRVWTGSGNMRAAGLARPSAGTATALNNAATTYPLGTTFYYLHTEYDSVNDVESPPSAAVAVGATVANETFKYTFSSMASAADKRRLYRTQHGGSIFYLLAELSSTILRYYDGDDSEALGNGQDNDGYWSFRTVDDLFLSRQPTVPMVGEPLRANYITENGVIPKGDICGFFQRSQYIAGVPGFPDHLYFSPPDRPEVFSPVSYIPMDSRIRGVGTANDRLILFGQTSIQRLNSFPFPTDPGFGLENTVLEEVTHDHGCVAKRTVVNFGVGQPNNRLFYLSSRGPMMTDGYETFPLNEDLDWSERLVNFGALSGCVAVNFPKYQQVWLFAPSPGSSTNDVAFIYHYHPNHQKKGPVGKWTMPVHIRCAAATVVYEDNTETRLYTGDTNGTGNVYQEDTGDVDAQNYDSASGQIRWEWMTGDDPIGAESRRKRVQRIFLGVQGSGSFALSLKYAVNKAKKERQVNLSDITTTTPSDVDFGTSSVALLKTKTYRAGVWQSGSHFRFHLNETAQGAREVTSFEAEVEPFGRQN